ncbi:MAG: glycosyltransferase family 25 protein [Ferruginibacter sp.]
MTKGLEILNDFFDKIYVITLKRSPERQQKVNKHFANVHFEFFFGVDKMDLDMDQLVQTNVYDPVLAKKKHRNNKEMFLGQVACSLSHRELYKEILAKGYQHVLIMEDDFVPADINMNVLASVTKELPPDWELVYFGYYHNENISFKMKMDQLYYRTLSFFKMIKWTANQVSRLYPRPFSTHLQKAGFHNTTHAYAVSARALPKLIETQTPVIFCADTLLTDLVLNDQLNAFITKPKIFDQEIFMEGGSKVSYITD